MTCWGIKLREELKEVLIESMTDVLEKLTFMFVEEAEPEEMDVSGRELLKSRMTFSGEKSGSLELYSPKSKVVEISANVLGLDEEDLSEEMYSDSFREVLNVLLGNILTAEYGVEPVFDLSVPKVEAATEEEWNSKKDEEESLGLLLDEDPVILNFSVED
jgi:chemotaxis protein CheY-P-specific phosphatase CheC